MGSRRDEPEDRRDVDDRAAPLLEHLAADELAQQEQRIEVDVDDPTEVVDRLVLGCDGRADAGVVHQHVDATEALDGGGDEGLEISIDGHIARHRDCARQPLDEGLEAIESAGRHHDGRAGGVEDLGEPQTQPTRCPGDDRDGVVQPERGQRVGCRCRCES
jgi:hypothetical protein